MIVVLDTNVALTVRVPRHPHHAIMRELAAGRFAVAVSTAIWLEYEEIITALADAARWRQFATVLGVSSRLHGNVHHIEPSFSWHLIAADPDDDKFADCAIAAEAEWIITDDGHFAALAASAHKPRAISPMDFIARFLTS